MANRFVHHTYAVNPTAWVDAFPTYWGAAPELGFAGQTVDAAAWQRATAQAASLAAVDAVATDSASSEPSAATLAAAWPEADYRLIEAAGHSMGEPGIQQALLMALD